MNYPESEAIFNKINSSQKILLNCHRSPDADSVGCSLALNEILTKMNKTIDVICPDIVPENFKFMKNANLIKEVNFAEFDFSTYDLFLITDSASWELVSASKELDLPKISIAVIDHHATNKKFGEINLVDGTTSSCAEVLYKVMEDWKIEIEKDEAQCLLSGIIGDTGSFQFFGVTPETLRIGSKLIEIGADKDEIVLNLFRRHPFNRIKLVGKILENMKFDKDGKFVYSAVNLNEYQEFGSDNEAKGFASAILLQSIEDTDFGIIMIETEENKTSVSFRSRRKEVDVSKLAAKLGGGGHRAAAGASVVNMPFSKAVEKIIDTAKDFAQNPE